MLAQWFKLVLALQARVICFLSLWGLKCVQLPGPSWGKAQKQVFFSSFGLPSSDLAKILTKSKLWKFLLAITSSNFTAVDCYLAVKIMIAENCTTWRRCFFKCHLLRNNEYIFHPDFLITYGANTGSNDSSLIQMVKIPLMWKIIPKKFSVTYWGPFQPKLFYDSVIQ